MISVDEIKKYLPQYLSDEDQSELFKDLKKFPNNLDFRFYSRHLTKENSVYQGDGLTSLLVINLPSTDLRPAPAMILSNTCDIDPTNLRYFPSRVLYSPIFQLEKYKKKLILDFVNPEKNVPQERIEKHIEAIKRQEITQILYLPKGCDLQNDSIVFFDRINNCPSHMLHNEGKIRTKLFTLSNYGFYVFMIKLSIHFTRIREGVNRLPA